MNNVNDELAGPGDRSDSLGTPLIVADAELYASGGRRVSIEHGLDPEKDSVTFNQLRRALHRVKETVPDAGPVISTTAHGRTRVELYPPFASEATQAVCEIVEGLNPGSWRLDADGHQV